MDTLTALIMQSYMYINEPPNTLEVPIEGKNLLSLVQFLSV